MRELRLLLFSLFVTFVGGCSIPRAVGMRGVALENSPVLAGGKRVLTDVEADFIRGPMVRTEIHSSRPVGEIVAFYRSELERGGWSESQWGYWKADELPSAGHPRGYQFDRTSRLGDGKNAWVYAKESMEMNVDVGEDASRPDVDVKITFKFRGEYAWDAPSKLMFDAIGAVVGNAGEAFTWVFAPF